MRTPKILADETTRLSALYEYDALNSGPDPQLEEVVDLASRLFEVPIALVSLVDSDTQVFAAKTGLAACGTSRDVSFCAHELDSDDILVVNDALHDPRFYDNPLVTGEPNIRFYAGAPLRSPLGYTIGRLCIIDRNPRNGLSARDRKSLRDLARLAMDRLDHRRLTVASHIGQSRFHNIAATSPDAIVCADHAGKITFWNSTAERLFGFLAEEAIGRDLDLIVPHAMRGGHGGGLKRVAAGGPTRLVGKTIALDAMHKDGRNFPIELSLSMWDEDGNASFGAIMRDITQRRENEDRLFQLAHHDALTALPNRTVVLERLEEAIAQEEPFHLLLVDLDGFKGVNDTGGHSLGDKLLKQVAERLLDCSRSIDTVARLGGDEFAILIAGSNSREPEMAADCIISAIGSAFLIEAQRVHIGASVGIASFPDHGCSAEELLSNADLAMYQAKREGRRCKRVFTDSLRKTALNRRAFEDELRRALDEEEFVLFYQPQVDLRDNRVIGAEALVRWRHPTRGLLLPSEFLPAIEAGMFAVELGAWVLETACAQAVSWRAQCTHFRMGVNLFEAQFGSGNLAADVRRILERTGLPAAGLELEVTENVILRHDGTMLGALEELHLDGVAIAFDDFGTGFASLSMLKTYPLTRIKIDRSFVTDIGIDPTDAVIVSATAALGAGLGLDVIAEGVETEGQRDLLRLAGCNSGQGYLFGKPMSATDFERYTFEPEQMHTSPSPAA
jgi:diguanylate cyclase (GGDEF)-like protein/PAS domain S-box-containing protein